MRAGLIVLAGALIALPTLAAPKPTPTPVANRKSQTIYQEGRINTTKSNVDKAGGKTAIQNIRARVIAVSGTTLTVLAGNGQELTFSTSKWKGPALNAKVGDTVDITYTQTPGGPLEATTVNTTRSNTFRMGGTDANVTPTVGPVEREKVNTTKSNSYKVDSTDANVTATPGPVDNSKIKSTKSNTSDRDVANTMPTAGPLESTTVNTSKSNTFRKGQPAAGPAPAESINLNSSRSNRVVQETDPPTVRVEGKPVKQQQQVQQDKQQQKAERMPTLTGRVLSQQGRRFTVLVNGKAITFSGANLKTLPRVGATVDIDSIRTPDGQLEATRTVDLYLKGTSR